MRWEYQLMRDMLERAREYSDVQTFECVKTAAMLKQAAIVMTHWDRKISKMEEALKRISEGNGCRECGGESQAQIAREALG